LQDVVIQMLQYYPNLLTSQTPPPLTDAEFSRLPSLTISLAALGACAQCYYKFFAVVSYHAVCISSGEVCRKLVVLRVLSSPRSHVTTLLSVECTFRQCCQK